MLLCRLNSIHRFEDLRDAEDALYYLDGHRLRGKRMEIQYAQGDRKTPVQMKRKDDYGARGSYRSRRRSYSRSPSRSPRRDRRRSRSYSRSPVRRRKRSYSRSPRRSRRSYSRSPSRSPRRSRSPYGHSPPLDD